MNYSAAECNCCSFYYDLSLNNSLQNTDLCKTYFFLIKWIMRKKKEQKNDNKDSVRTSEYQLDQLGQFA